MEFLSAPAHVASTEGVLGAELLDQVIVPELPVAEAGGWVRTRLRRTLRKLGVLDPALMGRNLCDTNEVALRVITAEGAVTLAIAPAQIDGVTDLWSYIASRARA